MREHEQGVASSAPTAVESGPAGPVPTLMSPVGEGERIAALDVARGFALIGILFVNMQFFAMPFGSVFHGPPREGGAAELAAYYFVNVLCAGKFFPLFSLLFGMGLVVQMSRARAAGRGFGGVYARRLVVLGLIGAAHALLLWYGDILFIYAWLGLILAFFVGVRAKGLIVSGVVILLFATVLSGLFLAVTLAVDGPRGGEAAAAVAAPAKEEAPAISHDAPAAADESLESDTGSAGDDPQVEASDAGLSGRSATAAPETAEAPGPFGRLLQRFGERRAEPHPGAAWWMALETEAYRHGPYLDATGFRAISWAFALMAAVASFGWTALGMFFLGAGLMKVNIFDPSMRHWHRRFVLLGFGVGLPGSIAGAVASWTLADEGEPIHGVAAAFFGPMMSLGYLGAVTLIVSSGAAAGATRAVGRVGRMALTCYLLETAITTAIMYHWGLGKFGELSRAQQWLLVPAIYAVLLVVAAVWLRFFTMGPIEWAWRTLVYLRPQPIVRRG